MRTTRTDYPGADTAWVCARKKAIPDERLARRTAIEINDREGAEVVAYYACTRCGQFHIGRLPVAAE